jgi:RPA family protein
VDDDIEKRVRYKTVEADIIEVSLGVEEKIVSLTLYSDRYKTQTNIFLNEESIEQVIALLGKVVDYTVKKKIEVLPGYQ